MLSVTNIYLTLSGKQILSGVSLSLSRGKAMGLMGRSGSGKSSLLKIVASQLAPSRGSIFLRAEADDSRIILLAQELYLWPHLSLYQNISLPSRYSSGALGSDDIHQIINHLGIRHLLSRYPREVSGGERQRAAIARAISVSPHYLLLDEPTSALDRKSEKQVVDLLRSLKKLGTGLLIASHNTEFCKEVCEECYELENGKLYPFPTKS